MLAPQPHSTLAYITPMGKQFMLTAPPRRSVMGVEGEGMPNISFVTQHGVYQQGEFLRDTYLTPRTVQVIMRHKYTSYQDYWDGRNELLSILSPGLTRQQGLLLTPGLLRRSYPDGSLRDLNCVIQSGPSFLPHNQKSAGSISAATWQEWSFEEALKFVAHDPTWYDPRVKAQSFNVGSAASFPITFPITFADFDFTSNVNYVGTWETFPVITLVGPSTDILIINESTGNKIEFKYPLATGQVATIDLSYGRKSVTLSDGTNIIGYITPDSDLVTWRLVPGYNRIRVYGQQTGAATGITIQWYDRYIGV